MRVKAALSDAQSHRAAKAQARPPPHAAQREESALLRFATPDGHVRGDRSLRLLLALWFEDVKNLVRSCKGMNERVTPAVEDLLVRRTSGLGHPCGPAAHRPYGKAPPVTNFAWRQYHA